MKKRWFMLAVALIFVLLVGCSKSEETKTSDEGKKEDDSFPEKPITLIVPYDTGGSTDTSARVLAEAASKHLPNQVSIVVENKPGGSSTVGLTQLFNAEPDGYTVAVTMETGVAIKTHTDELQYEWDSFEEVLRLVSAPQLLIIREDAPWQDFGEWLEYVKANPGKFKYAHSGVGSIGHLAMEELASKTGIEIVGIPYSGGGPSMQALLSGEVDGAIGNPYQVDDTINRILIDTGAEKSELFEAQILKDYGIDSGNTPWIGLLATPGVPESRLDIIHQAFKKALEDPEVKAKLTDLGLAPYYADSDEFREVIKDRYDKNKVILEAIGAIK
ncbi:Bug family tripartite tricarboxylate transporter substrate binding protein [Fredinandcohnia salidurans]|uniref:Bug family tripartite tricarboxylate transporter substrate binding protein n=1 Tax=Fredinandcohnia salidurans TaxID=2595041 RepID=A0ABW4MRJ5_9BACI